MQTELQQATLNDRNEEARCRLLSRRGEPLFIASWERAIFFHYEVEQALLQDDIPFELELFEGRAYVSVVAFTMRGMRPRFGGRLSEWLFRPIATHEFLNVRTYVRQGPESGIFFVTEWLSNPMCVRLGPLSFGLPYRFARIHYGNAPRLGRMSGEVTAWDGSGRFTYEAAVGIGAEYGPCLPGTLTDFLLERYTAFTSRKRARRFFRVWHEPWRQLLARARIIDSTLLQRWRWFATARLVGANYSPGLANVWMGWPHRVELE